MTDTTPTPAPEPREKVCLTVLHTAAEIMAGLGSHDVAVREHAQSLRKRLLAAYHGKMLAGEIDAASTAEVILIAETLHRAPPWVKALRRSIEAGA